jgi:hypothetical protein
MRALNYLIKDIYEWIANIQGLGSIPSTAIADHDHKSAGAGGDYPFGDLTQSMVTYLAALQAAILVTDVQSKAEKDDPSGYAGLDAASRTIKGVDTTDDIIVDLATKGLVLKDTQGTPHYWRVTVETDGSLTTTDLGTVKP